MKTVLSAGILAALFLLATSTANAFVKLDWDCHESQSDETCMKNGGLRSIFIYDEISASDANQFATINQLYPKDRSFPKVFINSRGGSMTAAIEIGRILRSRKASIEGRDVFFPDRPAMCNSACVSLAAGAVERQFDEVGIHRPYVTKRDKFCKPIRHELNDEQLAEDLNYFTEMGMPQKLNEFLKATPSRQMKEFFYDPDVAAETQMIVQLGFRMKPHQPAHPAMYDENGQPRFASTIAIMERGVAEGNAEVAYKLGQIYEDGAGEVKPDAKKAIRWYEKAGQMGNSLAYHALGVMHGNALGGKADKRKAAVYYRKAAELGYAGSQNNLGWSYYKGEGVPKSYGLAIYWLTRAIEQGEAFAYASLGEMRFHAHGFPADDSETYKWLKLADETLPKGTAQEDNKALLRKLVSRMSSKEMAHGVFLAETWRPLKKSGDAKMITCD